MNPILNFIRREPALVIGVIAAMLTLAAAFGFHLGDQQQAAIMAFVQVVLSVIIRSQVTPVSAANTPAIPPH